MRLSRIIALAAFGALSTSALLLISLVFKFSLPFVTGQTQESTKSFPPDLTPYMRPAIPEDRNPVVRPTPTPQPPGLRDRQGDQTAQSLSIVTAPIFIRDVVVSNSDPTLNMNDTFGDTEPTIAVNPENLNDIVIAAFSGGWGANAPIWHSTDGGTTWTKRFTVPAPPGVPSAVNCPCDQVVDYGRGGRLSITFLTSATDVYTGTTTNPANVMGWNWFLMAGVTQRTNMTGVGDADQPWLDVNRDPTTASQDNLYVAYDDFSGGPDMQVSVAGGTNPPNFTVDNQSGISTGSINPGHRLTVDPNSGAVYSLFQRFVMAGAGGSKNLNYMLNRSTDGGTTWTLNGSANGIVVATADSTQPTPKFGTVNALLGGVTSAAVDPGNGDVYYVFGNRDSGTGNNRLSIVRLTSNGMGGLTVGTPTFITGQVQAALPSIAITDNGTIGVLYTTFDGIGMSGFPVFTAHLALSTNQGATFTDRVLSTFLSVATDNGNSRQRVLGDYQMVRAVGNTFFGVFTGNGVPFGRPFANHDPIFFRFTAAPVIQVPANIAFADTCVGTNSTQTLQVCNTGGANLSVTSIMSSDPQFTIVAPMGGFPVNINCGECFNFTVRFTPTSTGMKSANLTVASNDPANPSVVVMAAGNARKLESIACPADIIAVSSTPGSVTSPVMYPPPVVVDSFCATSVVCTPPSGSNFMLGTTTVTCKATDAANQMVSCSFKVTLFDVCLQDDATGDHMFINTFTGEYVFVRCGTGGFTMTGKGTITRSGCITRLEDDTRVIAAEIDRCLIAPANKGKASIKRTVIGTTFMLNDSNILNNTCKCP